MPAFVGTILILLGFFALGNLVIDGTILDPWTTRWTIGVISMLVLTLLGFIMVDEPLLIGIIHPIASMLLYMLWGYQHFIEAFSLVHYLSFMVLIVVTYLVGVFVFEISSEIRSFFGWCLAIFSLVVIYLLIDKYIVQESTLSFWSGFSELVIIFVGCTLSGVSLSE